MSPTTERRSSIAPSLAQPSVLSAEVLSPTTSSSFSQADTLLTGRSHYTANTGGRARHSWRNSINGFLRTPSFLSNDSSRSTAYRSNSVGGIGADGAVSPIAGPPPRLPAIELPASPVAGPDDVPCSFFEPDSESDGEPVLSHASSVRAQRPQLVQHNSSVSGRSLRVYGASPRPSLNLGPLNRAQQTPGSLYTLYDLTPQAQRSNPDDTRPGPLRSKAQQLLGIPLNSLTDLTPAVEEANPVATPGGPAEALEALTANTLDGASTTALAPTPSSKSDASNTPSLIIEVPNDRSRIEALSTLPSPLGGLGSLRVHGYGRHALGPVTADHQPQKSASQSQTLASATDGLRSNPVQETDTARLHRAISAPPLPFRNPNRKVTIRPLDLEAAGDYRLHQSVVGTPYPIARNGSVAVDAVSPLSAIASTRINDVVLPTPSEERDRFPSPARSEILCLELEVARHPSTTTLVQVNIQDRSTYNDEALFIVLRKAYTQSLLGLAHYFVTARTLHSVTFTDPVFDASSFRRHLHSPKLGHKRNAWLRWLRERQVGPQHRGSNSTSTSGASEKSVLFHLPASTPRMPFSRMQKAPPRLTFHFEFSLLKIAFAVAGIILMSALAAVFWVLFGVPGLRAGQAPNRLTMPTEEWQLYAQGRVLTGLVLGVFVALLGSLVGAGWIGGSWLLL